MNTPRTDKAEEADSHAFQILYPHMNYRGVKGDRMRELERENAKLREALKSAVHYMRNGGANIDRDYPEIAAMDV